MDCLKLCPFVVILLLAACAGASREASTDPLDDLVGVELASLPASDYQAAVARIARHTGSDYPVVQDAQASRETGPLAVLDGGDVHLVLEGAGPRWLVTGIAADGRRRWQAALDLGVPAQLDDWDVVERSACPMPLLMVRVAADIASQGLYWALTDEELLLVRVEDAAGRLRLPQLSQEHPELLLSTRDLSDTDRPTQRLAALVRLAQASARQERSISAVRDILAELASSTNIWVAEAAAQVAIQPTR